MVREPDATRQPTPHDIQLMSKHRVLSFKPQPRLEWRGQDGQNETEQPDHSASLGAVTCLHQWDIRGKVRDNADAVWHARIITYMAGVEGEMALLGSTNGGDGDDRYQIEMMAEKLENCKDWNKLEARLRTMTRMLVRRHRALIERVANTLLRKTTLSGVQLDKLIGRGVDDVKVNAPWLFGDTSASLTPPKLTSSIKTKDTPSLPASNNLPMIQIDAEPQPRHRHRASVRHASSMRFSARLTSPTSARSARKAQSSALSRKISDKFIRVRWPGKGLFQRIIA
jgi:hypothetical protein